MFYLLFTTTTCTKCPAFKNFVKTFAKFPGKVVDEKDKNFYALTLEFAISSVPTIIVFEDESMENACCRTSDPAELYAFLQGQTQSFAHAY